MAYVWAHRGASALAPENTMEAFRLAEKMGADGFELDAHLSCDGELVVTHDENVRRVTGGVDRMVGETTLSALKALDVSCGKRDYAGARIPTLEEVLTYLKTTSLTLNIEIKSGVVSYEGIEKKTVEMVRAFGLADRVLYSSFNHHSLLLVRQADPHAKIGLLYSEGMVDPHLYAQLLKANAIHPHELALLIPGAAEGCLRAGIEMNPWTVDDPAHMRKMLSLGCNALITNVPDVARAVLDARG